MYIPQQFNIEVEAEIHAFIAANAFGQLISTSEGRPFSTHIPFLLAKDKSTLLGHLALNNPQQRELDGQEVLVSLQGPHGYVSPSWYTKAGVPTWNYQAVHIYGRCSLFSDKEKLKQVVDGLTEKYEKEFERPWQPDYPAEMLTGIIGVEVQISEIQCKFKISQNKTADEQKRIMAELKQHGANSLAMAMLENV